MLESQDQLSIDDDPLSWPDDNDSLESMSELDEEEEGVEDDLDDDIFDLIEAATINCLVTSRAQHPEVDSMRAIRNVIVQ